MNVDDLVWSGNAAHPACYKTLSLLRLYERSGSPVFFILESVAHIDHENPLDDAYFYNEHSCPTNYVPVEAIFTPDDDDPHGVFDYVRTAWYTKSYDEAKERGDGDEFLRALFPETLGGITIEGSRTVSAQERLASTETNVNEQRT